MKKILLSVIIAMSIIACKEKTEISKESSAEKNEVKSEMKDTITEKKSEITFKDYKTEYKETTEKAKIDFNSNPTAKSYKTVISEIYKIEKVNFAGNYIIVTWGCGTSCISGAMVDVRDGKVYDLPNDDEWEGIGNSVNSDKESTLLITSLSGMNLGEGIEALEKYWNWNEANKKFEFIKIAEVKTENEK
ncbi:hypothetical protein B0I03_105223 [Flavobacterium aquaticum]|uniref:Lipoprotein n=1 Tax=Flavobacterium aquaticum TaxID=1236486 RepID=A0A327YNE3_9FLAO|nr:hypothetical protein [Flavobacterium aquaticum]RAK21787.1 hypothetical protein B0I03_105223 [Flavobacterium aquaticum]